LTYRESRLETKDDRFSSRTIELTTGARIIT